MRFRRLFSGSLARRFALVSAALAGAALLLTLLASWWLVTQQHQAGLRELRAREADFHAASVASSLRSLSARMSEVAGSAILANALVDSAGRETYLQPYLDGAREVDGIPVELMVTDFEGAPIATSAGAGCSTGCAPGSSMTKMARRCSADRPAPNWSVSSCCDIPAPTAPKARCCTRRRCSPSSPTIPSISPPRIGRNRPASGYGRYRRRRITRNCICNWCAT
jgi:hypothetical protein